MSNRDNFDEAWDLLCSKAAGMPSLLGNAFYQYARSNGLNANDLCDVLGVPMDVLQSAFLCRMPRAQAFLSDVKLITERTNISEKLLIQVIRYVESANAFAESAADDGILMAARSKPKEESDEEG